MVFSLHREREYTCYLQPKNNDGELHAAIEFNGEIVAVLYGHGDDGRHDQGSHTVVLSLQADRVFIRNIDCSNDFVYGGAYSGFSGVLLHDM